MPCIFRISKHTSRTECQVQSNKFNCMRSTRVLERYSFMCGSDKEKLYGVTGLLDIDTRGCLLVTLFACNPQLNIGSRSNHCVWSR